MSIPLAVCWLVRGVVVVTVRQVLRRWPGTLYPRPYLGDGIGKEHP